MTFGCFEVFFVIIFSEKISVVFLKLFYAFPNKWQVNYAFILLIQNYNKNKAYKLTLADL